MERILIALCLSLLPIFLFLPVSPAEAQSGIVLKSFPIKAGKLLLDPNRPQLYATLPADNSLAVINTDTNTVVTTFFIGSDPVDLAISPDGTRLYVANNGSTAAGIGVVDLTSLTALPSLPSPVAATAIAAGLGNRLYVAGFPPDYGIGSIVQLDANTGAVQATFPGDVARSPSFLKISPDNSTIFCSEQGEPTTLASYDVSTPTPTLTQETPFNAVGDGEEGFVVSHDGKYLVYPEVGNDGYVTTLIPTSNLTGIIGTLASGSVAVATISADDSMVYQVLDIGPDPYYTLKVFSTQTFDLLESVDLPSFSNSGLPGEVTSLAVVSPNGYLYVASSSDPYGETPIDLVLVSTQTAPFFNGSVALSDGFFYLQFSDGTPFGYYNFNYSPYLYHNDLGFEYPIDAADGSGGVYLYDFTSQTFFYTSTSLFPYLYDFTLNSFLYYYPNAQRPGYYTSNPRYFYDFASQTIITK